MTATWIAETATLFIEEMGLQHKAFTWEDVVDSVSRVKGIEIEVRRCDIKIAFRHLINDLRFPTGICVPVKKKRVIIAVQEGLMPLHEDLVVYHELGHFLLGHVRPGQLLTRRLIDQQLEEEAEEFARCLCRQATETKIPTCIKYIKKWASTLRRSR